jgi:hypothetical protein
VDAADGILGQGDLAAQSAYPLAVAYTGGVFVVVR